MYYVLTKLSDPGFIMGSSHYDLICSAFEGYVCDECGSRCKDFPESPCAEEYLHRCEVCIDELALHYYNTWDISDVLCGIEITNGG